MRAVPLFLASSLLLAPALHAQTSTPPWDPLFFGYGTDPEMDFGGRTVMSLQSVVSRAFASIGGVGVRHPGVAPAWEFPVGAALLLLQHEVGGHGGRGREFGLGPSYSFNYDFSAATGTERPPATNEENAAIGAGGVEADHVMAHRVILDLLRPAGADGAKVPLAFMAKLDLTQYVATMKNPDQGQRFAVQYRNGNDMAYYLVSRQAQRVHAPPERVWNGTYQVFTDDPALASNYDDARVTALWNLLDPSLVGAVVNYFREHVVGVSPRVHAPVLHLRNGVGLTVGTRGALGPQEVSRFLDVYLASRLGVFTVYARDLDSSLDRTYGFGLGLHGCELGPKAELSLAADAWDDPESLEGLRHGRGWNAVAEVDAHRGSRWGLAAKLGSKSDGFFPGLPLEDGIYVGLGVQAVW